MALSRILPARASDDAMTSLLMSGALVPAAAERAHQRHCALVLRRAHLQRLAAVAQLTPLCIEQIELADVAVAVAHLGERGRARRGGDGALLRFGLLGEQRARRELVLDVLEGDEHLLAVARQRDVELGARRLDAGIAPPAVKER